MNVMQIDPGDVAWFRNSDPRQAIAGLRQYLLPKLKRLRAAGIQVAQQRLSVDPKALMFVECPANRPDAQKVVFRNEAYAGVSWPRSRNPLAIQSPDGQPRFYPPTYLYFGLYPPGHLRVQLLWYRYKVEPGFRHDLRSLVESQGDWLLDQLRQRGIGAEDDANEPLGASLARQGCRWTGKPLAVPITEGDVVWSEAIEDFVFLLPFARAAWRLAFGDVPNLAVDCLALQQGPSTDARSTSNVLSGVFPDEVDPTEAYREGAVHRVLVNAYERNPDARRRCIAHHGTSCCICGFHFGSVYGSEADGFIHVHHLRPLAQIAGEYEIDPIADLRPVCPNCHAVLHLGGQCRTIEEVRQLLRRQRDAQ